LTHSWCLPALKLNVTLVQPDVYIEQDAKGKLSTIPDAEQKPGLIKTELDTIHFNKADVALVPHRKTGNTKQPFKLAEVNGSGQLLDQNQLIALMVNQSLEAPLRSRESRSNTTDYLTAQVQNLLASDVTRLVELPLDLRQVVPIAT